MRPCNCCLMVCSPSSTLRSDPVGFTVICFHVAQWPSASLTTTAEMFTNSFLVRLSATHTKIM